MTGVNTERAFTTRDATRQDARALVPLLAELGYTVDVDALAARLDAHAQAGAVALVAVAADAQDAPLGLASLAVVPALHAGASVALITAFVVAGPARRQGIGRLLLRELEVRARSRGCARLLVTSGMHRADAHAFYESSGLPRTGVRFAKPL